MFEKLIKRKKALFPCGSNGSQTFQTYCFMPFKPQIFPVTV